MALSSRQRVSPKAISLIVIVAIVFIGTWGLWRFSIFGQAPSQLSKELESAKADGLPLTGDDLRSTIHVPDDQNAAMLLKPALKEVADFGKSAHGKAIDKIKGNNRVVSSLTPDQLDAIRPELSFEDNLFHQLALAVEKPKLDFHRDWGAGPGLLFPEFSDEKACIGQLCLKARVELRSGRPMDALETTDIAAKLSALIGQEPVLIALLVQAATQTIVCDVLATILEQNHADPSVLEKTKAVLHDLGPRPNILPAMRSEFLMSRVAVKMLASSNAAQMFGTDGSSNATVNLARFGPIRTLYELKYTRFFHDMYKKLSQKPESFVAMNRVFNEAGAMIEHKLNHDWTYGLVDLLMPVFTQIGGALGESEARRNVLLAAVDMFDARIRTGTFPAKIAGNSGIWIDPLTEKPLIYKASKDGFLIYSVGKDMRDDGGKPRSKDSSDQNYDIPFRYPNLPEKAVAGATSRGLPSAPFHSMSPR